MKKLLKSKWIIIFCLVISLVVVDMLVYNVPLTGRGIVVGIGLDIENDSVVMTSQLLLARNGGVGSGLNNYATVTEKGETMVEVIERTSQRIAKTVSLAHCKLIALGKGVIEQGRFDLLEFFFRGDIIKDNTPIVVSNTTGEELIKAKVALNHISTFLLDQILLAERNAFGVTPMTLKHFFVNYATVNGSNHLPVAELVETEPPITENTEQKDKVYSIIVKSADVMSREGKILRLTERQTQGLSLIEDPPKDGTLSVDADCTHKAELKILDASYSNSIDLASRTVDISYTIKIKREKNMHCSPTVIPEHLTDNEKNRIKGDIAERIYDCFKICQENNLDVFNLYRMFYAKYGAKWRDLAGDEYIRDLKLNVSVKVEER